MIFYQKKYYQVDAQDKWFQRHIKKAWYLLNLGRFRRWRPANLGRQRNKPRANRTGKEKYI